MKARLILAALLCVQAGRCLGWGSRAKPPKATPQPPTSALPGSLGPLEPLTAPEIDAARDVLNASKLFGESASYLSISLQEPPKEEPASDRRLAFALVYDRQRRETSEAIVDVTGGRLESWRLVPGIEPGISDDELRQARELAISDPRWKQSLEERGRGTWDDVAVEGWTPGPLDAARNSTHRLVRLDFYAPDPEGRRFIDGLQALVDLTDSRVLELSDDGGSALAAPSGPAGATAVSTAAAPATFVLSGHQITWRGWIFRYALTPREGLTLSRVRYGAPARNVVDRASVSEAFVLYGDPRPQWSARSIFQEGERGFGQRALSLDPGLDAPEGAALLDEPRADGSGRGQVLARAVAVFERDGGRSGSRRIKELVVRSKALVGPETYVFSWIFGEDGELDPSISVEPAPRVPAHQHFFNYRIDFDVDGSTNSIDELEAGVPARPSPAPSFPLKRTPLQGRDQARRDADGAAARRWLVTPSSAIAASEGYLLVPQANDPPLAPASSPARKLAPFIDHQLWVTAYHPEELYAAGEYPGRARVGGVERWTRRDESIRDGDVVVWYTLGTTHVASPFAPSGRPLQAGFRLAPTGVRP